MNTYLKLLTVLALRKRYMQKSSVDKFFQFIFRMNLMWLMQYWRVSKTRWFIVWVADVRQVNLYGTLWNGIRTLWMLLKAASLELVFRLCLLYLLSLLFIILLEHKNADVELEEEIQSVLREGLHSQPGNALTLKNHWRTYKYCCGLDESRSLVLVCKMSVLIAGGWSRSPLKVSSKSNCSMILLLYFCLHKTF